MAFSETVFNFYVNLQENKEFFTIRSNPPVDQTEYIKNDVSSWVNVINEFQLWIDRAKQMQEQVKPIDATIGKKNAKRYLEGATNFEFRNDNVEPVLNVKTQADIFFKIIRSIKKNETGLLMGVFGRWGRGKTFFWKELRKRLDASMDIRFSTVEFHAWKYQDTPASWAYLYEQFVVAFYDSPRIFAWINFKFLNRVILNMSRLGSANLLIGILWLLAGFIWLFFVNFQFKWNLFTSIISGLGVSTIISIIYYYFSYSGRAKDLFKLYWSEVSFEKFLGVQAEIQRELRHLVRAWIPEKKVGKKRLILFVDDIDRCNEDRIIQVIDALKVMIDDRVISDRLIVIAAIDETVLKRAIKSKYFNSVVQDPNLSESQQKSALNSLCKEYMDKLFISGFKLGNLSKDENEEIFRNLVGERTFFEAKTEMAAAKPKSDDALVETTSSAPATERSSNSGTKTSDSESGSTQTSSLIGEVVSFKTDKEIMEYELDFLLKAVRKYGNATPRAIRIFYYRYLLAKQFKDILIKSDSDIFQEWNSNQEGKTILPLLMIEYSSQKKHDDLLGEIERIDKVNDETVQISVLDEKFTVSRHLYMSLLKIVEIVVPY